MQLSQIISTFGIFSIKLFRFKLGIVFQRGNLIRSYFYVWGPWRKLQRIFWKISSDHSLLVNFLSEVRDSKGTSKLSLIQMILPYTISYIKGSSEIPLISLSGADCLQNWNDCDCWWWGWCANSVQIWQDHKHAIIILLWESLRWLNLL